MGQLLHHQRRRRGGGGETQAAGWQRPGHLWSRPPRADASGGKSTRRAQALGPPALCGPRQDSLPGGRRDEDEARHNEGSQNRCRRLELSEGLSQRRRFTNGIASSQGARRCGPPESGGKPARQGIASGAVVLGGGAAADGPAIHLRWREEIMIHPFETQQNREVILRSELSRRSMLRGIAATAFAAAGL